MKPERVITAVVAIPVFFAYIYFLPPAPFFLFLLIGVGVIAMREFYQMYSVPRKLAGPGVVVGGTLFYVSCQYPSAFLDIIFLGLFLLLFKRLFFTKTPAGAMSEIGPLGVGFFYIAGFLSFQWFLITDVRGVEYIILLYISIWTADSAAYYIGTYFGKNKLYPAVSPNKTVEGFFASIVGGSAGVLAVKMIFDFPEFTMAGAAAIGAILGLSAVVGDLIGSMFKRDAGVKNSSDLIPGHGGMLDKIDSVLIAGPVLYLIYNYILRSF